MLPINVEIVKMEVENGRAEMELALPVCFEGKEKGSFELYLWEAGALSVRQGAQMQLSSNSSVSLHPVFYSIYPVGKDDECVIKIVQPHLWEGIDKPYLYHLEIYWMPEPGTVESENRRNSKELVCDRFLAIRTICHIPGKGYFLNGQPFLPKCIFYDRIVNISSGGEQIFWEGIMQKLRILAQMGANTLILGSGEGMSEEERMSLQKYCDRVGLLLRIGEKSSKNDNCVPGALLFESPGLPTDIYYRYRSLWSKEPFVYISAKSLHKQVDGGYALTVYTNCKKVTLMVNDKVFGICEGAGEILFQDIPLKGFPVDITARAEEHSMTVRCYGI